MATCFLAGYFIGKNSFGSETSGYMGGIIGLIGALLVEVGLVIIRAVQAEELAGREARRRARKPKIN
jgi:hypothetical protein